MKKILLILAFSFPIISIAQNDEIDFLKKRIAEFNEEISIFNDSINILNNKIDSLRYISLSNSGIEIYTIVTASTELIDNPSYKGRKISSLSKGDTIKVIDFEKKYYKAISNNKLGYVLYLYVESNDKLKELKKIKQSKEREILEQERKKEQQLANEQKEQQDKFRKSNLISQYGQNNGVRIYENKIWIGMTKEMAIDSWGEPDDINRTVGNWGVHEQWIYGNTYVYFENGKLTSWQD